MSFINILLEILKFHNPFLNNIMSIPNEEDNFKNEMYNETNESSLKEIFKDVLPTKDENNRYIFEFPIYRDLTLGIFIANILIYAETDTQPIEFQVIPDTGSSILTVGSNLCPTCSLLRGQWDLPRNAFSKIGYIQYGSDQYSMYSPQKGYLYDKISNSWISIPLGVLIKNLTNKDPVSILGLQNKKGGFLSSLSSKKIISFDFIVNKLIIGKELPLNSNSKILKMFSFNNNFDRPLLKIHQIKNSSNIIYDKPIIALMDSGTKNIIFDSSLSILFPNQHNFTIEIIVEGINKNLITLQFQSNIDDIKFDNINQSKMGTKSNPKDFELNSIPIENNNIQLILGMQWLKQHNFSINYDQGLFTVY